MEFSLCATEPEVQELNAEIGFFKAVKAGIMKLIPVEGAKKLLHKSTSS
ncbi:hypothetical protein [Sporosarcina sp. FSL K6-2383]